MTNVGLSEGLVQFTKMFSEKEPCEHVHTTKLIRVFYEAEPDFWLSLVARNAVISTHENDNTVSTHYVENEALGRTLKGILEMAYAMFRLFHGKFEQIVEKASPQTIRDELELFMPRFIKTTDLNHLDILRSYHGIHFLPVDKNAYLRIQSFVSLVEGTFKSVKACVFLYRGLLVWSGLELGDMRVMYHYICSFLNVGPGQTGQKNGFLTGPRDIKDDNTSIFTPSAYLGTERNAECNMVVFQDADVLTMLFIDSDDKSTQSLPFYKDIDEFLSREISVLSNLISQQYTVLTGKRDDPYRYIYFNQMNLAMKTSLPDNGRTLNAEVQSVLSWMHEEFSHPSRATAELCIKAGDQGWIVGRKSEAREYYVLFDNQNANLIEINEDVQKLIASYFSNIFIA